MKWETSILLRQGYGGQAIQHSVKDYGRAARCELDNSRSGRATAPREEALCAGDLLQILGRMT